MIFNVHSDTSTSSVFIFCTLYIKFKIVFNNLVNIVYTQSYIDTHQLAIWHVLSCMEYQLQNITSRIFLHHSPYIIGYLLPTYIRCRARVTYHLPHTRFLKNCISMTLLTVGPQCNMQNMLAADAHARTLQEKKKNMSFPGIEPVTC